MFNPLTDWDIHQILLRYLFVLPVWKTEAHIRESQRRRMTK